MKKFFINVHYDLVVPVEVFANTEEEAIDMAEAISETKDFSKCDVFLEESCVTKEEDYPIEKTKEVILLEVSSNKGKYTTEEMKVAIDEYFSENPVDWDRLTIDEIAFNVGDLLDKKYGM